MRIRSWRPAWTLEFKARPDNLVRLLKMRKGSVVRHLSIIDEALGSTFITEGLGQRMNCKRGGK